MQNESTKPSANGLISLHFTQSSPELQYYEGRLQKMVVGLCPPCLGSGLLIGFGTTGRRNLSTEWKTRAVLLLLNELREGIPHLGQSLVTRTPSRLAVSLAPDQPLPLSFAVQPAVGGYALELQLAQEMIFARVLLDLKRAEALTWVLQRVNEGFQKMSVIL